MKKTNKKVSRKAANSVGVVTPQTASFDKPLKLESGGKLTNYELVYESYGELNKDKSNAILICHALSSNHHVAGYHSKQEKHAGWWDKLVGPGKVIDTNHFYVVCCNNLGGCSGSTGPSSINSKTKKPFGPDFPIVTVKDWVNAQAELADYLGISQWSAVIGGSLGGMQALQWSISYPERIRHCLAIASSAKLTAQNIGFNEVARQAIRTDPDFHEGRYYEHDTKPTIGLRLARMLGHITYLSDDMMAQKFGRNLQKKTRINYDFNPEFEVESYLRYQGERFVDHFDANTYLLMTKALDYFDPASDANNSLSKAFNKAVADYLVISFTSDWRFAPERSREIVRALQNNNLNVSYAEINAPQGHDAFLLEIPEYIAVMKTYMKRIRKEIKKGNYGN